MHHTNRTTRATYTDLLTIAKLLGIDHRSVRAAADRLVKARHLKIKRRMDGMTDLIPLTIDAYPDDTLWPKSRRGDAEFYKARDDLIEMVLFDRELTPAQRVVALGIMAKADPVFVPSCKKIGKEAWGFSPRFALLGTKSSEQAVRGFAN